MNRNVFARPIPVPPGRVVKKSWKIFFLVLRGDSLFPSRVLQSGREDCPERRKLTAIVPFESVNSQAFSRRFRDRLMNDLPIDQYGQGFGGSFSALRMRPGAFDGWPSGVENFIENIAGICFLQIELHWFGEVQECFHGAVQPVDFAIQHLHGLLGFGINGHVGL